MIKMKRFILTIALLFFVMSVMGCETTRQEGSPPSNISEMYDDTQQSQIGSEGGSWIGSGDPVSGTPSENYSGSSGSGSVDSGAIPGRTVPGFRIQISAMSTKDGAMTSAQNAADRLNLKGYVEQDAGLWKVRMGNARSRQEAEDIRDYIRNNGFPDAWIVDTNVVVE
ncbi:MAG: hypothetical protein B6244_01405 [Candidatus Cloacimonetes bacterium 4572_55]|nr:MAG: hypothetical protein B6244_01405 [Candidatus Cloacimonetes bacterium 4572_55]